jgi:hypothetical protein
VSRSTAARPRRVRMARLCLSRGGGNRVTDVWDLGSSGRERQVGTWADLGKEMKWDEPG